MKNKGFGPYKSLHDLPQISHGHTFTGVLALMSLASW